MKVKELKKLLETFDENLEVVVFEPELAEFFPLKKDTGLSIVKVHYQKSCIMEVEDAKQCDDYDEKFVKDVLVI